MGYWAKVPSCSVNKGMFSLTATEEKRHALLQRHAVDGTNFHRKTPYLLLEEAPEQKQQSASSPIASSW